MLYREIVAVCYEIHTKHINTVCGQNVEFLNVKLVVHIVTSGLERAVICVICTNAVARCNKLSRSCRISPALFRTFGGPRPLQ